MDSAARQLRGRPPLDVARWSNTTVAEKKFLAALAWLQEGTDGVERGMLAGARGISTTGISTIRSQLLEKGLIQTEGRGRVRITIPGFLQYIREQEYDPHPSQRVRRQ